MTSLSANIRMLRKKQRPKVLRIGMRRMDAPVWELKMTAAYERQGNGAHRGQREHSHNDGKPVPPANESQKTAVDKQRETHAQQGRLQEPPECGLPRHSDHHTPP